MLYIIIAIAIITVASVAYIIRANKERQALEDQILSAGAKVEISEGDETPNETQDAADKHAPDVSCCGAHEVCEAETLLTLTDKIVYYEDEELDAYRGTGADDYADAAIEEFRDVLLTLPPHEVAGWMRSLGLRGIEPPTEIREEALMVVSDFRDRRMAAAAAKVQEGDATI